MPQQKKAAGTRGLQELAGGTEHDLEVTLDFQEVRARSLSTRSWVKGGGEFQVALWRAPGVSTLGSGQVRSLTCWVTLMEVVFGKVAA